LKCASQPEIAKKFTKTSTADELSGSTKIDDLEKWNSWSFKMIDVGTTGKLVGSACYDKQQVCAYLQPFSRQTS